MLRPLAEGMTAIVWAKTIWRAACHHDASRLQAGTSGPVPAAKVALEPQPNSGINRLADTWVNVGQEEKKRA